MQTAIDTVKKYGAIAEACICYTEQYHRPQRDISMI